MNPKDIDIDEMIANAIKNIKEGRRYNLFKEPKKWQEIIDPDSLQPYETFKRWCVYCREYTVLVDCAYTCCNYHMNPKDPECVMSKQIAMAREKRIQESGE